MTELHYQERTQLPALYTIDKNGKERVWKIWTEGDTLRTLAGLVDGKKVPSQRSFKGKNVGKKNETSPEEQAKRQAESRWVSQLDKNYKPKSDEGIKLYNKVIKEKAKTGGHSINAAAQIRGREAKEVKEVNNLAVANVEKIIKPMKAQVWDTEATGSPETVLSKVKKYFDFTKGVYVQWKLDGWRCVARMQGDDVVLTTNTGKQYPWFASLRQEIKKFVKGKNILDGLDGELYAHHLYENGVELDQDKRFSLIQSISAIRSSKPHPLEDQMCLYVFDLVDMSGKHDQTYRFKLLEDLFRNSTPNHVIMTDTKKITSQEEIGVWQDQYSSEGYEGVIIRSPELKYRCGYRSLQMRKYKYFIDKEYIITGAKVDEGVSTEHFVWILEDRGKTFYAKPMGTREEKFEWWKNRSEYLGKSLTVKFQEYTEDGIPRFPIAKGFREIGDF